MKTIFHHYLREHGHSGWCYEITNRLSEYFRPRNKKRYNSNHLHCLKVLHYINNDYKNM